MYIQKKSFDLVNGRCQKSLYSYIFEKKQDFFNLLSRGKKIAILKIKNLPLNCDWMQTDLKFIGIDLDFDLFLLDLFLCYIRMVRIELLDNNKFRININTIYNL